MPRVENDPRILVVGPAARSTDFGAIVSVPISRGKPNFVDTWAGRGGLGSKMLQEHGIAAIIYGGTYLDEDFRDRKVADAWFIEKYRQKLAMKDFEGTTKYRFDPKFDTGEPSASIMRQWAAASWPSTTGRSAGPRRSGSGSRAVHLGSLPEAVQRGNDQDQTAGHLRNPARRSARR